MIFGTGRNKNGYGMVPFSVLVEMKYGYGFPYGKKMKMTDTGRY